MKQTPPPPILLYFVLWAFALWMMRLCGVTGASISFTDTPAKVTRRSTSTQDELADFFLYLLEYVWKQESVGEGW